MIPPPPPIKSSFPPSPVADRSWGEILSAAGYPTDCVVLDWETYFDSTYSLSKLTVPQYIHDRRFEVLGLAYRKSEFGITGFAVGENAAFEFLRHLQSSGGPELPDYTVIMHNAPFDAAILAWKYGIRPKFIIDTLDLARSWHSRSKHGLDTLATQLGLQAKGCTADFNGWSFRKRMVKGKKGKPPSQLPRITDQQVAALGEYAKHDADLTWAAFVKLLPKLSNPKQELAVMAHTRRLFLEPTLEFDWDLADHLASELEQSVKDAIPEGLTSEQLSGTISFDALLNEALHEAGDSPIRYQKHGKKGLMYGLAKTDDTLRLLLAHESLKVRGLINGRIAVKSAPLHVGRINTMRDTAIGELMPIPLRYAGGHTGRFSGSMDINVQNLPPKLKPLLVAPPGQTLVQADLAAIEARVLAYLAGQDDLCEAFRAGADIYCQFATTMMGFKVRKPRPDDPPPLAAKYKAARQRGKISILGCGYGMGANHFLEFAEGQGVALTVAEAENAITTYRTTYPNIPKFWYTLERAFRTAAQYRRPCSFERGLKFYSSADCDVTIELPSGRCLRYHKVRIEEHDTSVFNDLTRCWDRLWGGVLAENCVQAVSRDTLVEAMMRLEALDIHTSLHVHDSLVIPAPTEDSQRVVAATIKELTLAPIWAPGLPLAAEAEICQHYK